MGDLVDGGQIEIRRSSLLERLEKAQPKIVALVAPAGFGKSTLARQLVGTRFGSAICDASGICGDLDLARRLLPALALEHPERAHRLTQCELMLGDDTTSVAARVNLALEAWKEAVEATTFVFENAEHIADDSGAREFFARLLGSSPPGRQIVICSRTSLRIHLTRFAAPHEIVTLRAADLAFDRSEMRGIFGEFAGDPQTIVRITQLSQGWPIAVLLLKRFANEGRIERLLETLDDVAFEELHDYLADQVLASIDRSVIDALFACAAIPNATVNDLRLALPDEDVTAALEVFAKESPFLTRSAQGVFNVHPLLASLLLEHRSQLRLQLLAEVAGACSAAGEFQRAAELYLALGDQAAAAKALGQHEVFADHAPSMAYARVLASLDRTVVQAYPRLWAVTVLLRTYCVDMEEVLDESEAAWRTLSPKAAPMERFLVLLFRAVALSHIGLADDANELVDAFADEQGVPDEPSSIFHAGVFFMRGMVRARGGKRLGEAEAFLMKALHYIAGTDVFGSGTFRALGSIALARGEHTLARQLFERALSFARRSGLSNVVAISLMEAAFGDWFFGDNAAFAHHAGELDETVRRHGVRGLACFAAAAVGRDFEASGADLPVSLVCAHLLAASVQSESAVARRQVRAALTAAQQCRLPFFECIAAVTGALVDDSQFDAMLDVAREAASRCESPALQAAVLAIAQREEECGMLAAFVERMKYRGAARVAPLDISLASGRVRGRGREVLLPERELALLFALALRREVVSRTRLADVLWPELDERGARNALSVTLHRLRRHLGNAGAVVHDAGGYRLEDGARVDLWELDRRLAAIRSRPSLRDSERSWLAAAYEDLRAQPAEQARNWSWFEPTERHLRELRLEIARLLASDALRHGVIQKALELAREMIAYDPCDESACEIALGAHLRSGDHPGAMREYRRYQKALLAELQCEPSEAIKKLVGL